MGLRILQVCASTFSSGTESHIVSLSKGLQARGHHVLVAVPKEGWLAGTLADQQIPISTMKMKDLDYWISIVKLVQIVRKQQIDILHTHLSRAACIGHAVARITRVPQVATAHVKNTARIYKRVARRKNRLIAVSHYVADLLVQNGVPTRFIETVHHGTNFAEISPTFNQKEIRNELGIPDGRQVIVQVGKICRDKGQLELVEAFAALRNAGHDIQLVLVGRSDPKYALRLDETIQSLGLEGRVTQTGVRNDVVKLLDSFDIAALPSRMETFGLAALEASARSKPVVATRVGALQEVVSDEETGLLVDLVPSQIADALDRLLQDRPLREEMGRKGRCWVEEGFTIGRMVGKTEAVYRAAVGN